MKCCKWWVRGAGAAPGGVRDCAGCRAQPCLQDKPPSGVCGGLAPSRDGQSHPWCAPGPPDPAMPLVWRRACFAPCPKHTSSTPTAQADVWKRGKNNPSSSPWQAPEDGFGALRLPLARGRLRAALHTPHPAPRPVAPGAVGFGRQQPLRNAERSHFAHSCFVHRGWALPRPPPRPAGAEGSKYRTHPPTPHPAPTRQAPSSLQLRALLRFLHKINTKVTAPAAAHVSLPPACRAVLGAQGLWGGGSSAVLEAAPLVPLLVPHAAHGLDQGLVGVPLVPVPVLALLEDVLAAPVPRVLVAHPPAGHGAALSGTIGVGKDPPPPPCPGSVASTEPQTRSQEPSFSPRDAAPVPRPGDDGRVVGAAPILLQHLH